MLLLLIFGSEDAGEESLGKRDPRSEAHVVQDLLVSEACGAKDIPTSPAVVPSLTKEGKFLAAENVIALVGMRVGLPLRAWCENSKWFQWPSFVLHVSDGLGLSLRLRSGVFELILL